MSGVLRESDMLSSMGSPAGDSEPALTVSESDVAETGERAKLEEAYRRQVRARLAADLRSERERMRQHGRYYFESAWLTEGEIRTRRRAHHMREWARLLELIAILLALGGGAVVVFKVLLLIG